MTKKSQVAYFVHDLSDAAVRRRIRMLQECGCEIHLFGFRRTKEIIKEVEGVNAYNLGLTYNKRFLSRALQVTVKAISFKIYRETVIHCNTFMARNLEMLFLAVFLKKLFRLNVRIVYEALDVHRIFYSQSIMRIIFRFVEKKLVNNSQSIITSSPAFISNHFAQYKNIYPKIYLIENKVLRSETQQFAEENPPADLSDSLEKSRPPWSIAWLGIIRCKKSLDILLALAYEFPTSIIINIYGKPALDEIPNFNSKINSLPNVTYHGPYDRQKDLARIYRNASHVWAIDYYDEGFNSDWLLPNRLYEGSLFGAIPVARANTEVARWLEKNDFGMIIEGSVLPSLIHEFTKLDAHAYHLAKRKLHQVAKDKFISGEEERLQLRLSLKT